MSLNGTPQPVEKNQLAAAKNKPKASAKPVKVHVLFGSLAVSDMVNKGKVTQEVLEGFNEYEFASQELADAFIDGVEAACGWLEFHIPEQDELKKILRKQKRENRANATSAAL